MNNNAINRKILNSVFFLSTFLMFGQAFDLSDFTIDSIPTQENYLKGKNSKNHWIIYKKNDSIKIEKSNGNFQRVDSIPFSIKHISKKINNQYGIKVIKKVDNGYIIGLNRGEFGGGLWFLSSNGKVAYEIAPHIRVRQIFEFNNELYITHGLNHIITNRGSLLQLKKGQKWGIFKTYKLPDKPLFILRENENILIITSEYLMSFNKYKKLIKILKAPFYWGVFYPSSAVTDKNNIYIAMRKGVLKISNFKYTPQYEWLIKK